MCGEDAVKYLLVGANAVQVCTAIYLMGFEVLGRILDGLREFMDRKGYQSIDQFRGNVLGKILKTEEVFREHIYVARIDPDRCTNCGLCYRSCMYSAIVERENRHEVIADRCDGCGLCVEVCPSSAVKLIRTISP